MTTRWSNKIFSREEYCDMIKCYFASGCVNFASQKLYAKLYPNRRVPGPSTIYQAVRRAYEDPDVDINDFKGFKPPKDIMDDNDEDDAVEETPKKKKKKFINEKDIEMMVERIPVVYTKRLDDMKIFRKDIHKLSFKRLMKAILKESKPKLKGIVKSKDNTRKNLASYDKLVQALKRRLNEFVMQGSQAPTNEVEIPQKEGSLESVCSEDADVEFVTEEISTQVRKDSADEIVIIDDDDASDSNTACPNQDTHHQHTIHQSLNPYRRVFLSFICTYAKINDLYYVDEDGTVKEYYHITINEDYEATSLAAYVGVMKTFWFKCCCWYKRQKSIAFLRTLPKRTVSFMSKPHSCSLSRCNCCCCPQNEMSSQTGAKNMPAATPLSQHKEVTSSTTVTKTEDDDEITQLEQAVNDALLDISEKMKRQSLIIKLKNKWLKELQDTAEVRGITTLINQALMKEVAQEKIEDSNKTLEQNSETLKDFWQQAHFVMFISYKMTKQVEIYEIYKGALISSAVTNCYLKSLHNVMVYIAKRMHSSFTSLGKELNVIKTVTVPCCWYFREALISNKALHSALNFMRRPHTCIVGNCRCCCKSLTPYLIDAKLDLNQKYVAPKIKRKSAPKKERNGKINESTNVSNIAPKTATAQGQTPLANNILPQVIPGTNTFETQTLVMMPPSLAQKLASASIVDNEIVQMRHAMAADLTSLSSPSPTVTPTNIDSNQIVKMIFGGPTVTENPLSKITLFTPERSCTITTFPISSDEQPPVETISEFDPLGLEETNPDVNNTELDPIKEETSEQMQQNEDEYVNSKIIDEVFYPVTLQSINDMEATLKKDPLLEDAMTEIIEEETDAFSTKKTLNPVKTTTPEDFSVKRLISSILDRFRDVRLYINDDGYVAADLGAPISSLSSSELKILANILARVQEQVKNLGLTPGTTLNGQIGIDNNIQFAQGTLPVADTPPQSLPKIENVFSLAEQAETPTAMEAQTNQQAIRVRPANELLDTTNVKPLLKTGAPLLERLLHTTNMLMPQYVQSPRTYARTNRLPNILNNKSVIVKQKSTTETSSRSREAQTKNISLPPTCIIEIDDDD